MGRLTLCVLTAGLAAVFNWAVVCSTRRKTGGLFVEFIREFTPAAGAYWSCLKARPPIVCVVFLLRRTGGPG